jgi:hypothetical protein
MAHEYVRPVGSEQEVVLRPQILAQRNVVMESGSIVISLIVMIAILQVVMDAPVLAL